MNKSIVLMLVVLACAAYFSLSLSNEIKDSAWDVSFEETTLYGDIASADGITVHMASEYEDYLFWNNSFTPSGEVTTEHRVIETNYGLHERWYDGIRLSQDMGSYASYGGDLSDEIDRTGFERAYQELYEMTPNGEEREITIDISDYMDFYEFTVSIDFPGIVLNAHDLVYVEGEDVKFLEEIYGEEILDVVKIVSENFKFPVEENEEYSISMTKNEEGNVIGIGGSGSPFSPNIFAVMTNDAYYFILDLVGYPNGEKRVADASYIGMGHGIYKVPLTLPESWRALEVEGEDEEWLVSLANERHYSMGELAWYDSSKYRGEDITKLDMDGFDMVFPLDASDEILHFDLSNDFSKLYLYTRVGGVLELIVIDIATMEEVQSFEIENNSEDYWANVIDGENVITVYDSKTAMISVFTKQEDGLLNFEFKVEQGTGYLPFSGNASVYDEGRLIMVGSRDYYEGAIDLLIYEHDGLKYHGEYMSSLNSRMDLEQRYYEKPLPYFDFKLTVE